MKKIFSEDEIIDIKKKLGLEKDQETEEIKEVDPKKKIAEQKV